MLSDIVGQQRVLALLKTLFERGRLPHALLFHGPDGSGKEAVAIELARSLNCERGTWEACGACASCEKMRTLQHPRFHLVFPMPSKDDESTAIDKFKDDELAEYREQIESKAANPYHRLAMAKAQGIKISSIRDIRHASAFRAGAGGRTVVLICEADRMNANAANALLKTLEEPTGDLLLVLSTAKRDALLPTIVSRCQQLRFDPLATPDIEAALQRVPEADPDRIPVAARLAAGSYRLALELATDTGLIDRTELRTFLLAVVRNDPVELMQRISKFGAREDRRALLAFLAGLAGWFRDVLAVQAGFREGIINSDLEESIVKFTSHYDATNAGEAIAAIEDVVEMLQKNVHVTTLLIVLAQRLRRAIHPRS